MTFRQSPRKKTERRKKRQKGRGREKGHVLAHPLLEEERKKGKKKGWLDSLRKERPGGKRRKQQASRGLPSQLCIGKEGKKGKKIG